MKLLRVLELTTWLAALAGIARAAPAPQAGSSSGSGSGSLFNGAMAFINATLPDTSSLASAATPSSSASAGIPATNNNGGGRRRENGTTTHDSNSSGSGNSGSNYNGQTRIYNNCQRSNMVAITFDDGTQPNQAAFRRILDNAHAKGTFFVNGNNYRCIYDPDMVSSLRDTYAAGHEIAPHSWAHTHSSQLTDQQFEYSLDLMEDALSKILGIRSNFFRPPYGDFNDANMRVLSRKGYSANVLWEQVSGPGTGTSVQASNAMYQRIADSYPAPHMVLNHEQDTVSIEQILPQAIRALQHAGYRLVTVSECLGLDPYAWTGSPQQRDSSWTCSDKPAPGQAA